MKEELKNAIPPQEDGEKRETSKLIHEKLSWGFGGSSQLPDSVVGMAIIGQFNNGDLMHASTEEGVALVDDLVASIHKRWEDIEDAPTTEDIRAKIIEGMKTQANDIDSKDERLQDLIKAVSEKS